MIEIGEVETDFALARRGDFDQPAAQGEARERASDEEAYLNRFERGPSELLADAAI